jgi:flagellar protein FlaG
MVGNASSVTTAPARTPAPKVQDNAGPGGMNRAPAGKTVAPSGVNLPPAEPPVSSADVERAVQHLRELIGETQRSLRFQVDELSGRTVITVLDETTKEIVRQIPAPEVLAVAEQLRRIGTLIDAHG